MFLKWDIHDGDGRIYMKTNSLEHILVCMMVVGTRDTLQSCALPTELPGDGIF